MARRKFYKTKVVIEVLSEDNYPNADWDLSCIDREITHGNWVGEVEVGVPRKLTGRQIAKECRKMNSIPDFFDLNDNGKTLGRG